MVLFKNIAELMQLLREPDESSDGGFHQAFIKDVDGVLGPLVMLPLLSLIVETCSLGFH